MNTLISGIVYHVVDKTTGEVVKVGSTIRSLEERWNEYDKNKFSNHFLRVVKTIESSESDCYSPNDAKCPFLWHLIAAEHMEITRMRTFCNGPLSNKLSPLVQKYSGFDANEWAKIGGRMGGEVGGIKARNEKLGIFKSHSEVSRKGGLSNVKSGHLRRISSAGGKASGPIQGRKNAENKTGFCGRSFAKMSEDGKKSGKIGGPKGMHVRWHVNRGIISPACKYCNPSK